ncbi:MAG: hypothetical protein BECKG1743D_GA0114223_102497 [Candidatus Kentron sp. G]|nr:MAG: hypothetical protein BECKG1743E_GA0114224_101727 [Candidatus Kentron sp. G]VFM99791.1 MAG: hypothetical protein BECKG1743F_GA0114225_104281 [Candidatus Kentron sp. G]VFN01086.1 MAG: hypothetical protein BECKG1743D_GA0114223_102497 [Candidatus Kentron sp. G]
MLENDIFEQWLGDEAARVLAKLKNDEPLTQDDKLIIVLKGQMNHFYHLDVELRQEMLALREDMKQRDVDLRQDMKQRDVDLRQDMKQRNVDLRQDMDRRNVDLRQEMLTLRQDMDRRFEVITGEIKQIHTEIRQINDEIKQMYRTINAQTWKIVSLVGLFVLLGKVIENF